TVGFTRRGAGSPTFTTRVVSQPSVSAISTLYSPGQSAVALAVPWPVTSGVHVKLSWPTLPVTATAMAPSHAPAEPASVTWAMADTTGGCSMVKLTSVSQPVAVSAMSRVYGPGQRPVALGVPCPSPGAGVQVYASEPTPPVTAAEAVPLH